MAAITMVKVSSLNSQDCDVHSSPYSQPWEQVGLVEGECVPCEDKQGSVLPQSRSPPPHSALVHLYSNKTLSSRELEHGDPIKYLG